MTNVSGTVPNVYDYTDIYGYTGVESDFGTAKRVSEAFSATSTVMRNFTNMRSSNVFSTTTSDECSVFFGMLGTSAENEPDYTLGSIIANDNLRITTANNKDADIVLASTFINNTGADIIFDEVGLFYHYNYDFGSHKFAIMLIKEKLSESMTLRAGESIAISFNLFGDVTIEEV